MKFALFLMATILIFNLYAQEFEEGKILIKFKENLKSTQIDLPSELKFQSEFDLTQGKIKIFKVDFFEKGNLATSKERFFNFIEMLNKNPMVEIAQPNFYYYPSNESAIDGDFKYQWGLSNDGSFAVREGVLGVKGADINALKGWEITTGNKNITVAVIDTGTDYNHPDLKGQIWINKKEANGISGIDDDGNGFVDDIYGMDFANNDSDPFDDHGHGTHIAGTIGASFNSIGVRGVMGNVSLMPIKYLPKNAPGSTENAIKCIDYALKMKANIINASWGGGNYDPLLLDEIKSANQKGVVMVTAAGNKGDNIDLKPHYPSSYDSPNIISVAATDALDGIIFQSSYGENSVHIAAPGKRIYSTLPDNNYGEMTGTSSATAFITGALGLLLTQEKNLSVEQIKKRLMETSIPLESLRGKIKKGGGRVDIYNLLRNIRPAKISDLDLVWEVVPIQTFESAHPYENRTNLTKTFKVPGAKFIRVTIEEFDMEKDDDFLELVSKKGIIVDRISGKGQNFTSNFTQGDEIKVNFVSDFINSGWGFLIKEVQVVR